MLLGKKHKITTSLLKLYRICIFHLY
uniref:Uncharacterized protein n=1 Tax=Rhizophora mucronata TaxID=61149 RepID=A0A2P2IHQ3_RHIMU